MGVFAVEGAWSNRLSHRETIRPALDLLERVSGIRYIHRHAETSDTLTDLTQRWLQPRHASYSVGFFAFHGQQGTLLFHGDDRLALEDLADVMDGEAEGKVLHLGACSVMRLGEARLQEFRKRAGLQAVTGYRRDVDWLEAASFDALTLSALTNQQPGHAANYLTKGPAKSLAEHLGFVMVR